MNEQLSKQIVDIASRRLSTMQKEHPRLFMGMNHHHTTKGERMTFSDKAWLVDIYKDNNPNMVIMKCSQVHMTEHALCGMFTLAEKGYRGMYVLPSKEHRKTFVKDRIDRQKDWSPVYAAAIKQVKSEGDSNVYKNIFGSGWKFVGSNIRKDFFEFPCDVLFLDEFDQLTQENIPYAYDRISDSKSPQVWKFGNPTRDNFGISKEFLKSDQKQWHVPCDKCGHGQVMEWKTHFVELISNKWELRFSTGQPQCEECKNPFDRLGKGKWVAHNPKSKVSGYRISRLFVDKHGNSQDIFLLYEKFSEAIGNPTEEQNFYNNYLAETYENADYKITLTLLHECALKEPMSGYDPSLYRAIMGVDLGKKFTCVISIVLDGQTYDIDYRDVNDWTDVEALEETFNVAYTVIDAQGGGYAETRNFVQAKGGRYMCFYRPKDQVKKLFNLIDEKQVVEVNRTEFADLMVQRFKLKQHFLPYNFEHLANGEYVKQMLNPARIFDAGGRPIWTKGGKDHFFHASIYRHVALMVSGMKHSTTEVGSWRTKRTIDPHQLSIGEILIGGSGKTVKNEKKRSWYR